MAVGGTSAQGTGATKRARIRCPLRSMIAGEPGICATLPPGVTREECLELAELVAGDTLPAEIRVAAVARILEIAYALGKSQGQIEAAFNILHQRDNN